MTISIASKPETFPLSTAPEGVLIKDGVVKGFHIPEDEAWRLVPEFARDRDFPFFQTTVDFVLKQVMEYAKLRKANEKELDKKNAWDKIAFDLDKSELLARMLEGKPMFTYPPPKSYKSHWYELVENGEAIAMSVKFSKWKTTTGSIKYDKGDDFAIIDDNGWEIIEVLPDLEFKVKYHDSAPTFHLRKATIEEQKRLLHPRQTRGSDMNAWILISEGTK